MDVACEKCGKAGPGQHYTFHYGLLLDTKSSTQDIGVARLTTQTTTYSILSEAGADICHRCASAQLGWPAIPVCLILGLSLAYFGIRGRISWGDALFCIGPGAFLVLVAIVGIFEAFGKGTFKADTDTGEKAAIAARRKDLSAGQVASDMVFWTSWEYSELLRKQKR